MELYHNGIKNGSGFSAAVRFFPDASMQADAPFGQANRWGMEEGGPDDCKSSRFLLCYYL